ncbi:RHS repeat domain-containing protein [Pseudomonas sp. SWRI68]|uniref:RHS repeat domain-containing protein n=1 Tax=Pseudomonas sp. SWRI68 TaxID=2745486 RepID=UPI001EE2F88E|nr:RHS repeat domain-containing protein [Pseudomonas sp. SWRI68]
MQKVLNFGSPPLLNKVNAPDGRLGRSEIDVAGQLPRYIDPAQKTLQFRYDRSGRLIERTDAMGYSVKFRYDAYGRLLRLINENDESYRFGWDELDRLVAQRDLDGSDRIYTYNVLDEITRLTHLPSPEELPPLSDNAPPTRVTAIRHDFERDALGRLVSKRTEDGTTEYRYDAADNLSAIHEPHLPPDGASIYRCISGEQFHGSSAS